MYEPLLSPQTREQCLKQVRHSETGWMVEYETSLSESVHGDATSILWLDPSCGQSE